MDMRNDRTTYHLDPKKVFGGADSEKAESVLLQCNIGSHTSAGACVDKLSGFGSIVNN
jgi:hypothetical protein